MAARLDWSSAGVLYCESRSRSDQQLVLVDHHDEGDEQQPSLLPCPSVQNPNTTHSGRIDKMLLPRDDEADPTTGSESGSYFWPMVFVCLLCGAYLYVRKRGDGDVREGIHE